MATGENNYSRFEFRELIERRAARYLMPDVCRANGFSETLRIARLAAAHSVLVSPHVVHELSLHVAGALSNGFLVEFIDWTPPDLFAEMPRCEGGQFRIPDRPGHGMALGPGRRAEVPHGLATACGLGSSTAGWWWRWPSSPWPSGVNARTAFSLFFPPILRNSAGSAGRTAGAFAFGFIVSNLFIPFLGRAMDRWGPRVVLPAGAAMVCAGLGLATFTRQPWHLYMTLGVLVSGGASVVGYTGQTFFLPNWFVRRRGLALGIAFSGVGIGSIVLFPWLQRMIEGRGWRAACWTLVVILAARRHSSQCRLRATPSGGAGLAPDGDPAPRPGERRADNVVDPVWAAVDWTLAAPCARPASGGSSSASSPG